MDFKEGDEIEIVDNPGYFWDRVKPGMRGYITTIENSAMYLIVTIPDYGEVSQHVSKVRFNLIRKVNRVRQKSGFAKFIRAIENVDNMQ